MYEGPGKLAQAIADKRAGDAMNTIVAQHMYAQQLYGLQGQKNFQDALSQSGPAAWDSGLGQARQNYQQQYAALEGQPMSVAQPNATESSPIVRSNVKGNAKITNRAQAANAAYGDTATQVAIANLLARARAGLISAMSQNLASSIGPQLRQAATTTDPVSRSMAEGHQMATGPMEMYGQTMASKGMSNIGQ